MRDTATRRERVNSISAAARLRLGWLVWLVWLLIAGDGAYAQASGDACATERISAQSLIDFPTAYAAIAPRAAAWRTDARLTSARHTFDNVDRDGQSKRWRIEYFSTAKAQLATFDIDKGVLSCRWIETPRVPYIPDLAPSFVKDVKLVLAVAAQHGGGALLARGYLPHVALRTYLPQHKFDFRSTRAVWGVNYLRPTRTKDGEGQIEDSDSIYVMIDANTGEFISATSADAWWKFWR